VDKGEGRWWITRMYAKANKGLLGLSGLKDVEESAGRLGYIWDNKDVGRWQRLKMGANLLGNSALSALNFMPAASMAGSMAKGGKTAYTVSKGGTLIKGMEAASPSAARSMEATARGLERTIQAALPAGRKATAQELRTLVSEANGLLSKHGVLIKEGGTIGESAAKGGVVQVSLKAGAQHEVVHALQSAQTRALLLDQHAAGLGKSVSALTGAERAAAFQKAELFEAASYAQHEMQAFRATGFMGMGRPDYAAQLLKDSAELSRALKTGTVLRGEFSVGQQIYGASAQVLGHSQFQIGSNLAPLVSWSLRQQKDSWGP